jgi:cell division protein FtsI/penicillin-binding protein 2
MKKVINDPRATGYKDAYSDKIVLAAKTGSATAPPRVVEWEISYQDPITGQMISKNVPESERRKFIESAPVPEMQIKKNISAVFPTLKPEDQHDSYGREKHLAHGWFTGFAPAAHPRIVTLVFIEYGIAGGSGAGPVFKDIMLKCQELGYIK